MSNPANQDLLHRLAELKNELMGESTPSSLDAPELESPSEAELEAVDQLLEQISLGQPAKASGKRVATAPVRQESILNSLADDFLPLEPKSLRDISMTESEVESLILKYLLARGNASGRGIAEQIALPFVLLEDLLRGLKHDQLVVYRSSAPMNDYVYELTDLGRERARRYAAHCTYFGAAPVSLPEYITSVKAQSLDHQAPTEERLRAAFADLLINPQMYARLGPAINSGKGMFLYGFPGNGKTSIAKRVTLSFGQHIWVPRAIGIEGEIVRLFDPMNHQETPLAAEQLSSGVLNEIKVDQRWVRIRRPTIVVGGELTMDQLEVARNHVTGISEAPLQLKSNCGTLVIDDFGRQRMSTDELLNRWIVPLEERIDFLNLSNGKSIEVPFDQLIVFSTNLEPKDLVDEAFLRRIPYKIEVTDPTEDEFQQLFEIMCRDLKFPYQRDAVEYLIRKHYRPNNRPFRACHPRDILLQIRNHCLYQQVPFELRPDYLDFAVENYFAVM